MPIISFDMPIYSHSRLSTFEQCKLKYKYTYIDRIPREKEYIEAFLGNRFHEAMERLYSQLKFKIISVEDLKEYFDVQWQKNWNQNVTIIQKERTPEDYKNVGIKAIDNYYKRYHPFDDGRHLGLERNFVVKLDNDEKYRIRGVIDRLVEKEDGHYELHDYKTSGYLHEQGWFDKDRQLALYEIAVREAWPDIERMELVWHYVVFDKEMRSARTGEQLSQVKEDVKRLIDAVEIEEDFSPHESGLCPWCEFQNICPLFAHLFKIEGLPVAEYTSDSGVELVDKYSLLKAEKARLAGEIKKVEAEELKLEDAVISLAEKEGVTRFYGSDKIIKIRNDIKVEYPKSKDKERLKFSRCLNEMGLWETVTDINWTRLKRVARREKWYQKIPELLKDFLDIKLVKRISLSKRRQDSDSG